MLNINYNPDVLTCLANLSNDEVFTPPDLVNQMLDMLPAELWTNKEAKFLDPVTKSGVFLREITKRLIKGLEAEIPDLQTRLNHILTKQVHGIAITELTSLLARRSVYCAKRANHAEYSMCTEFEAGEKGEQGNIRFERTAHTWANGKCSYCGASQEVYDRADALETHAYQFIHCDDPKTLFEDNMKFDVIIGNPPYQLSTDGFGGQAKPIYHLFVEQAKKLNPNYLVMITPARWFAGGMGLNEFRSTMLADKRLKFIADFHQSEDCFQGVEIKGGVCYFLWDSSYSGLCQVRTIVNREVIDEGFRDVQAHDILIRFNKAVQILEKVKKISEIFCDSFAYGLNSFGLPTNFLNFEKTPSKNNLKLYVRGGTKEIKREKVTQGTDLFDKYKVLLSKAYNAGDSYPHQIIGIPIVAQPNSCCTMTYFVTAAFDDSNQANNYASYLSTKFCRFMISIRKNTQDINKEKLSFVPIQDFNEPWTDEKLYAKYGLSLDEIAFIESMIRPMDLAVVANDAINDAVEVDDE